MRLFSTRISIALSDGADHENRRVTVAAWKVAALLAVSAALPLLIGLGARWSARAAIDDLTTANAALRMENESYREATEQLSSQISALQAAIDQIGARAKVDPAVGRAMQKLPERVKTRAMGGAAPAEVLSPVLDGVFGSPSETFGVLRDLLGVIEGRLQTVRSGVERQRALAAATPSMWPVAGWLSSAYGNRRDPFLGTSNFHPGLDISAQKDQPVLATADGLVTTAGRNGNYGNMVTIDHGFGITTRYAHLSNFAVQPGQQVRRGDVIGYVGSTGRSTSPHLHYEIWMNGRLTNPLRLLGPRR